MVYRDVSCSGWGELMDELLACPTSTCSERPLLKEGWTGGVACGHFLRVSNRFSKNDDGKHLLAMTYM